MYSMYSKVPCKYIFLKNVALTASPLGPIIPGYPLSPIGPLIGRQQNVGQTVDW